MNQKIKKKKILKIKILGLDVSSTIRETPPRRWGFHSQCLTWKGNSIRLPALTQPGFTVKGELHSISRSGYSSRRHYVNYKNKKNYSCITA